MAGRTKPVQEGSEPHTEQSKSYMILSNQRSERKEKPFDFDVIVTPPFQVT